MWNQLFSKTLEKNKYLVNVFVSHSDNFYNVNLLGKCDMISIVVEIDTINKARM